MTTSLPAIVLVGKPKAESGGGWAKVTLQENISCGIPTQEPQPPTQDAHTLWVPRSTNPTSFLPPLLSYLGSPASSTWVVNALPRGSLILSLVYPVECTPQKGSRKVRSACDLQNIS